MGFSPRLKREECKRTKHDSVFSQWEILIGPFDWQNHSSGKDGMERYRTHNIPLICSCPGLYELGVAAVRTDLGRDVRKLESDRVVVVYLGQADNVRTRLQHYGRAGSHLDHGKSFVDRSDVHSFKGPGLFKDIFSRGFPIVFRWAPMENKKVAENTEARLLSVFDYAWNKGGNGFRRPNDIYLKLDNIVSSNTSSFYIAKRFQKWLGSRLLRQKKEGIKIKISPPLKFRPGLVRVKREPDEEDPIVCGLSLGDGSVCSRRPMEGRQRCREHKGRRNNRFSSRSITKVKLLVSAMHIKDESFRMEVSRHGAKSSELHDEKKIIPSQNPEGKLLHETLNIVCGVVLNDHSVCKDSPIQGRKRCGEHKGMRIKVSLTNSSTEGSLHVCGVVLGNGDVCSKVPAQGRKRCEFHKGRRNIASLN